MDSSNAFLVGAMSAAIDAAAGFNAMADDLAAAMMAGGSQGMDCTFKAVKNVCLAPDHYLERFIVVVPTNFTFRHFSLP